MSPFFSPDASNAAASTRRRSRSSTTQRIADTRITPGLDAYGRCNASAPATQPDIYHSLHHYLETLMPKKIDWLYARRT